LVEFYKELKEVLPLPFKAEIAQKTYAFKDYLVFLEAVITGGRKGVYVQRYKGLGEMNPEQLWETTLDPQKRRLVRVTIEDTLAADEMFSVLMGEQVEPRKDFIVENALQVGALDI